VYERESVCVCVLQRVRVRECVCMRIWESERETLAYRSIARLSMFAQDSRGLRNRRQR